MRAGRKGNMRVWTGLIRQNFCFWHLILLRYFASGVMHLRFDEMERESLWRQPRWIWRKTPFRFLSNTAFSVKSGDRAKIACLAAKFGLTWMRFAVFPLDPSLAERSFWQAKVDSNRLIRIKEIKIGKAKGKAEKRKHNENIQWERNWWSN